MASLEYLKFLIALLFVLGLIAGLAWVARRFGLAPRVTKPKASADRRLDIVEILNIDARRRLLIIRRDDVEHLVMLGDRELLIENNIGRREGQGK